MIGGDKSEPFSFDLNSLASGSDSSSSIVIADTSPCRGPRAKGTEGLLIDTFGNERRYSTEKVRRKGQLHK